MNKINKKKHSIGKRVPCFWDDDDYGGGGDDIVSVAEILIQLPELILHAQSSSSLVWGAKRRRSAISSGGGGATKNVVAGGATSPATPLMFSPSESDDKVNDNNNTPSRFSPISKQKNKEDLMQSVTDLTHQRHSLVTEMEAAKRHLDVLRASNLQLKHRKQVIIYGFSQPSIQTLHQQQQHIHYPFQMQHASVQWSTLSSSVPAVNKMGPVGLPDLNLTLEEAASNMDGFVGLGAGVGGGYQASDAAIVMDYNVNNRALASAQARKRRMQIYKEKNQNQVLRQR